MRTTPIALAQIQVKVSGASPGFGAGGVDGPRNGYSLSQNPNVAALSQKRRVLANGVGPNQAMTLVRWNSIRSERGGTAMEAYARAHAMHQTARAVRTSANHGAAT